MNEENASRENPRLPRGLRSGWNIGAILAAAAGIGVFAYWLAAGGHFVTQYEVMDVEVVEDDFGDEIERDIWRDEFQFGLMPDRGYDAAAPLGGGLLVFALGLWGAGRFQRSRGL